MSMFQTVKNHQSSSEWKGPESASFPVLNIYSDVRRVELSAMVENVCPKTPRLYRGHGISSPGGQVWDEQLWECPSSFILRAFPSCEVSSFHNAHLPFSFVRWPSGAFILQAGSLALRETAVHSRQGAGLCPASPQVLEPGPTSGELWAITLQANKGPSSLVGRPPPSRCSVLSFLLQWVWQSILGCPVLGAPQLSDAPLASVGHGIGEGQAQPLHKGWRLSHPRHLELFVSVKQHVPNISNFQIMLQYICNRLGWRVCPV